MRRSPHSLATRCARDPATPGFVLRKGKVIPAVTERMLNSDLPGAITARVRENVYDAQGNLLIPFGSTLVGRYDSQIKIGQERVLFAFSDLILPNGVTFKLPAAAGSDLAGAAGVTGDVNNHFFKMFGTSLLIAVLADRTRQPESVTSFGGNPAMTAAGQVLADTSRTVLQRNQNLSPTITVDQGTRINVEVVADMVFTSHYAQKVAK
jgi:type IV secretory pathway VirB10-like protein